ncbi:MAG: MGMT family protein [Chloroflexota bacterium]|nr:MGMT family protein [Chloroflexia bacterium]MDQ3227644.1 MGMT family protein [Chloroflexota bacterium]
MREASGATNLTGHPSPAKEPSSKRAAFYASVFALVAQIPLGRVTTYGTIAHTLGKPNGARSVGWALNIAPLEASLPCHRVVNRDGFLSGGWHWGHPDVMAELLMDEGVPFVEPHRVDLRACLWIPDEIEY